MSVTPSFPIPSYLLLERDFERDRDRERDHDLERERDCVDLLLRLLSSCDEMDTFQSFCFARSPFAALFRLRFNSATVMEERRTFEQRTVRFLPPPPISTKLVVIHSLQTFRNSDAATRRPILEVCANAEILKGAI